MLETATSAPYEAGWNVKGDASAATWLVLLDRLAGVTVAAVGRHAPATTTALDALFPGWRDARGPADVAVVAKGAAVPAWADEPGVTVVLVGDVDAGADAALAPGGDAALAPGGDDVDGPVRTLQVPFAPRTEEAKTAARVRRTLARARVRLGGAPAPGAARTTTVGLVPGSLPVGTTIRFADGVDRRSLPRYVRDVAAGAGCDVSGATWSLLADADYWSQKALFVAGPVAVKVSRLPRFSARLANEHRGLAHVAQLGWGEGRSPAPLFVGDEAGLAVVGEEAVRGEPFESRTDATPSCPLFRRALGDLRDLAVASPTPVAADRAAAALGALVDAFVRLVDPPAAVRAGLERDVEEAASAGAGAVVHGDPAVWNLVVRDDGGVTFLDWENFEAVGPAFWDLALLVQTAGALATSRRGRRYTPATMRAHLFDADSPWKRVLDAEVAACARDLGVDPALGAPLLRLWLMFQGLKEATRHPAGDGSRRGLYASTLLGTLER